MASEIARTIRESTMPVVTIRARKGLVPLNLHEVWEYRELAMFFVWRDIKGRYRQMALGPLWIMIAPLINVVLYTIIFNKIAKLDSHDIPYPLFNYTGLLIWGVFSSVLTGTASSLLHSKDTIAKVYFPRFVMPLVEVVAALTNFLISLVVLTVLLFWFDVTPAWSAVQVPLYLLLASMLGMGFGFWWAGWIVHFRDLGAVLGYILKGWMYATPIVYTFDTIPAKWLPVYVTNPTVALVTGFRRALFGVGVFDVNSLIWAFCVAGLLLVGGAYYFRMTERSIVDIA